MQTMLRKWSGRVLLAWAAALVLTAPAANEPPQVYHCELRVVDAQGRPVPNASVESYRAPAWQGYRTPLRLESRATTDSRGTVAFTTTNQESFTLLAHKPGLSWGWNGWYPGWTMPGMEEGKLEILLTAPAAIAGTVQDQSGRPVADATVWVSRAIQARPDDLQRGAWAVLPAQLGRQVLKARTGSDGRFRIEGLPAGAGVDLGAAKPGLTPETLNSVYYGVENASFQAGQTDAVVTLTRSGALAGKVVREDTGAPLPGAHVLVGSGGSGDVEPALTDAQARFVFPDLLAGEYKLQTVIGMNAFPDWVCEPAAVTVEAGATNNNAIITASRGAVLKAILRDQSTGNPIRQGWVSLSRDNLNSQMTVSAQGLGWQRVPPGDYHVGTVCEGYSRYETQITLERGQTNEVVMELEPATRLTGTVLTPTGQPAAKVRVLAFPFSFSGGEKLTDAQGRFTLYSELGQGQFRTTGAAAWTIIARDPQHGLAATVEIDPDVTNPTVKLMPALSLAARVLDPAGKPITNAQAQAMFKTEHSSSTLDQPARTDATGQFELKGLPPGQPYTLIVSARGFGQEKREVDAPEPTRQRVDLEPFHLPVADQQVAGLVLDEEEKPVPGAWVNGSGENQTYTSGRTDAKGHFALPHVCAGQLQLTAHLPLGSHAGSVTVEAGDTNVVVHLGSSFAGRSGGKLARLSGSVVGPDGQPAPKVGLVLFPRAEEHQADAAGGFKFSYDANPFGNQEPLTLIARDPARNLAAVADIDPDVTNITVKLESGITLAGQVTGPQDQPLTNAEVQLSFFAASMGSTLGQPVRTGPSGRFEFKGLPAGRRYELSLSAKGFGRDNRTLEAADTATNRLQLAPFRLAVADQRVAGVVHDAEDKPLANAWVNVYGEKQAGQNTRSDTKGRFHFEHLTAGEVRLLVNDANGHSSSTVAQAGETNLVLQVDESGGGAHGQVTGTLHDPQDKPAPHVSISLFPFSFTEKRTDAEGHFKLSYNPAQWGGSEDMPRVLIARDAAHNLARAQELEPDATNADLKLEPALTLAGRVLTDEGQAVSNAQVMVMFRTERVSSTLGSEVHVGTNGAFEIKTLPPGGRYSLEVSALGFGRESRQVELQDNPTNRLELEPIRLSVADQRVAGLVLDTEDKPVAGAWVNLYGDKQSGRSTHSDSKGRFGFRGLSAGAVQLSVNTSQGGSATLTVEAGDTNVTLLLGTSPSYSGSGKPVRLTGTVLDAESKPVPKVRVHLLPYSGTERLTDEEGRFMILYSASSWSGSQDTTRILIARDLTRNLATAQEVDADITNATMKLEKGFSLAGRVTDPNGNPIPSAEVTVQFSSGRILSALGGPVRANAEGRFEIKALPPGCGYHLSARAKGFGQDGQHVEPAQADSARLEVEPMQLPVANLPLAGVVLNAEEKPVAGAWVNVYGGQQPNLSGQADAKGRFSFQVCAGVAQLSANSQRGGFAHLEAEGGNTNLTIHLTTSGLMRPAAPRGASLQGKPLPDITPLGFSATNAPAGEAVLAVLIDAEQRPSRHALSVLTGSAARLSEQKIALLVIQAGPMSDEAFAAWKAAAALPFPVGRLSAAPEAARAAWGTAPLPRLVLTDTAHRVIAEGFRVEELNAKLKAAGN